MKTVSGALQGHLPRRYDDYHRRWVADFEMAAQGAFRPGAQILDVGSGRTPSIAPDFRPQPSHYVGIDLSRFELETAPPGSYDECYVSDVARRVPELENRFDLAVSWQVLEHVRPLDRAFENVRSYLRPGGLFVAQTSATFSVFGILNQFVPHPLAAMAVRLFMERGKTKKVFPAYYHLCWEHALKGALRPWSRVEIVPYYIGAVYFPYIRPVQAAYLGWEEWAFAGNHRNLATHYRIVAIK